jgi:hypothetical protein
MDVMFTLVIYIFLIEISMKFLKKNLKNFLKIFKKFYKMIDDVFFFLNYKFKDTTFFLFNTETLLRLLLPLNDKV